MKQGKSEKKVFFDELDAIDWAHKIKCRVLCLLRSEGIELSDEFSDELSSILKDMCTEIGTKK